jgi:hypothetical protein
VVALTVLLAGEMLPAASRALTVYEYDVDGLNPESVNVDPATAEPTNDDPR